MRHVVERLVASPPVLGALVVLLLTSLASKAPVVADHDAALGAQADAVAAIVRTHFGGELRRITAAIVGAALCVGFVLGGAAGLLVDVRDGMLGRVTAPAGRRARALVVTLGLEAWFLLEAMARRPQLYADAFYGAGGARRTLQVIATDVLGPGPIAALGATVFLAYGVGAPRSLRDLPARVRALRSVVAAQAALAVALVGTLLSTVATAAPPASSGARPAPPVSPTIAPSARGAVGTGFAPRLNVVVLAADSLRADRLVPRTMPKMAALAERGTVFERAYVSLPRTFPSWVTLLTGRRPHRHGITTMFPTWAQRARDFDAVPQRFARAGYRTGVMSDYAGDIFSRIELGFQRVETPTFDFGELLRQRALERQTPLLPFLDTGLGRAAFPTLREFQTAADPRFVVDDAERFLAGAEPFFATVFLSAAHFPYAAAHPHYARFTDARYRGRFKYHKPVGLASSPDLDPEDVTQVRALYDGAVGAVDDAFDRLVRALSARGLLDRTVVVLTADHGETLFEQGRWHGHGDHLFGDEGTHVPLVVLAPGGVAGRVGAMARDVDLAPTLYELAGVTPPNDLDGRSLAPATRGKPLDARFAFAETELWMGDTPGIGEGLRLPVPPVTRLLSLDAEHGNEIVLRDDVRALTTVARHRMVRDERYKLLFMPTRDGAEFRLFDTQTDRDERVDVKAERPAELMRLKEELFRHVLADPALARRGDLVVPSGD